MMNKQILFPFIVLCILGGAIYLTAALISPPAPLPTDAPPTEFSAGRALQDLDAIAREPHPMGEFPARAAVRDYLLNEIRALGLEPQVQDTFGVRLVVPGWIIGGAVENILVRLPGTDPDGAILVIAHYDSTPGAPGAGDNGTGVVTLLELLRNLHSGSPFRQDVIFLFVDGEEPGLIGSNAFVAQHPWFENIRLVINLDVGRKGFPAIVQTSQGNGYLIQALARTAERPTYISVPVRLFPSGDQDLVPFKDAGIPGAFFALSAAAQETHTMLDPPETVDPASLQHFGDHILGLARYLADMPTLDVNGEGTDSPPEQLYFPLLGRLVHYPIRWAWPLAVVAGLFFSGTVAYGLCKKELTWKGAGSGLLTLLVSLAISLGLTYLLWVGIQALHPEYQVSPFRPHLSDDALYAAGFITLVLAIACALISVARKESSWYVGMMVGIVTFVAAFLTFVDRMGQPSGQEWLRGAMLSLVLIVILVIPFFKKNVLGEK